MHQRTLSFIKCFDSHEHKFSLVILSEKTSRNVNKRQHGMTPTKKGNEPNTPPLTLLFCAFLTPHSSRARARGLATKLKPSHWRQTPQHFSTFNASNKVFFFGLRFSFLMRSDAQLLIRIVSMRSCKTINQLNAPQLLHANIYPFPSPAFGGFTSQLPMTDSPNRIPRHIHFLCNLRHLGHFTFKRS